MKTAKTANHKVIENKDTMYKELVKVILDSNDLTTAKIQFTKVMVDTTITENDARNLSHWVRKPIHFANLVKFGGIETMLKLAIIESAEKGKITDLHLAQLGIMAFFKNELKKDFTINREGYDNLVAYAKKELAKINKKVIKEKVIDTPIIENMTVNE
jgi:hypothetical protein